MASRRSLGTNGGVQAYDPAVQPYVKDTILDGLAQESNVAQFVSFASDLRQRHAWVRGHPPNQPFPSAAAAIESLLAASSSRSLNVRSFRPGDIKSREFLYGWTDSAAVLGKLRSLGEQGLYTVVNETIDIHDGGISGVAFGNVLELAPDDTTRCVEKPGIAAFPREAGLRLLETVYRFLPAVAARPELRIEFSVHPLRRGYRLEHTILWEIDEPGPLPPEVELAWPNRFSRFLGDKAFGLLVAWILGFPVPHTQVLPRGLAPFAFGDDTGLVETWIRACPRERVPGLFSTRRGWTDPFSLLQEEDPTGEAIASVLCQQAVEARYSGALVGRAEGEPLIEGVAGSGDGFMVGRRPPENLPASVKAAVGQTYERAQRLLGPVRFEWAYDDDRVWILQLHREAVEPTGWVIVPGEATHYHRLAIAEGIEALRAMIDRVQGTGQGIVLVGRVGVTSHFGDLLRRARIPSRTEDSPP
jgi:hypothetical protein